MMLKNSADYSDLECSLSNDKHFVNKPIILSECGHFACLNCLHQVATSENKICKKCKKTLKINFKIGQEAEKLITNSMESLMKAIEKEMKENINKIKSMRYKLSE